jgi:hypothetical protein
LVIDNCIRECECKRFLKLGYSVFLQNHPALQAPPDKIGTGSPEPGGENAKADSHKDDRQPVKLLD